MRSGNKQKRNKIAQKLPEIRLKTKKFPYGPELALAYFAIAVNISQMRNAVLGGSNDTTS
jgi:hypothetical protein